MAAPQPRASRNVAIFRSRTAIVKRFQAADPIVSTLYLQAPCRCRIGEAETNIEPVGWQIWAEPFRPFDQRHAGGERILNIQFQRVLRRFEAIKVEVPQVEFRQFVNLHKGKCRTRDLGIWVVERTDQRTAERCFAGAKITAKRDDVARAQ